MISVCRKRTILMKESQFYVFFIIIPSQFDPIFLSVKKKWIRTGSHI